MLARESDFFFFLKRNSSVPVRLDISFVLPQQAQNAEPTEVGVFQSHSLAQECTWLPIADRQTGTEQPPARQCAGCQASGEEQRVLRVSWPHG